MKRSIENKKILKREQIRSLKRYQKYVKSNLMYNGENDGESEKERW